MCLQVKEKKENPIKAKQNAPYHVPCAHVYILLEEAYNCIKVVFVVKNQEAEIDK